MKLATSITSALAFAGPSFGAAVAARTGGYSDADVLNFALTLEHLEDKFYREGLKNYTKDQFQRAGYDGKFYRALQEVSFDETTHVAFLTGALDAADAPVVAECDYRFPATNPKEFVALASVLEGVGVSVYIGAAALISVKAYLTAAASILSVEAKHNSYLRNAIGRSPFPQPFDAPLSPSQAHALASQFIVRCPRRNPRFLPVVAFPPITVTSKDRAIYTGSEITLTVEEKARMVRRKEDGDEPCCEHVYAAFAALGGSVFVPAKRVGRSKTQFTVDVPAGLYGQTYVALTSGKDDTDGAIIAGPAIFEIAGTALRPGPDSAWN